jgi:ABC-type nitrate/sulfonate/bicarbonate transport system substrate-binding protein
MLANFWAGGVPQFSGAIHQSMIVTGSYAKAHPAVVAAVRRALALALAEIHRQPALAVRTLEKVYPKTNPAIIRQIVVNEGVGYPAGATISRRGFDIVRDFTARYVDPAAAKIRYRDAVWPAAQVR